MIDYEVLRPWLRFVFFAAGFVLGAASYVLTWYVGRYQLRGLLKELSKELPVSPPYIDGFKYLVCAWRRQWFLKIGVALFLKREKMDIGSLDAFDIGRLPTRFRRLAVINVGCVYLGFAWMVIAAMWARFE